MRDPPIGHQCHLAPLPRLEAHRRARGDIEAHAARRVAVKAQRLVGFEEMIMRAHLNGPVAAVGDFQGDAGGARVEFDVALGRDDFTGDHGGLLADRLMDGDKLCAIGKCRFHLHVVDHLGDPVHHLGPADDMGRMFHEIGDAAAIARAFHHDSR